MWFGLSFFAVGICGLFFLSSFFLFSFLLFFFLFSSFIVTGICVQFLSYTAFSAVGLLSFLMSSDAKEHIRDKLRCRSNGAVASARPRESAAIFPGTIRWCTGQPSFCLPFGFYFSLGCFH